MYHRTLIKYILDMIFYVRFDKKCRCGKKKSRPEQIKYFYTWIQIYNIYKNSLWICYFILNILVVVYSYIL